MVPMSSQAFALAALSMAIAFEVLGTTMLQQSQQFTRVVPTVIMLASYLTSLFFLSVSLKVLPVGIAYAIWSGLGIVLITAVGYVVFKQKLDAPALLGMGMIVAGVATINLFSRSVVD